MLLPPFRNAQQDAVVHFPAEYALRREMKAQCLQIWIRIMEYVIVEKKENFGSCDTDPGC